MEITRILPLTVKCHMAPCTPGSNYSHYSEVPKPVVTVRILRFGLQKGAIMELFRNILGLTSKFLKVLVKGTLSRTLTAEVSTSLFSTVAFKEALGPEKCTCRFHFFKFLIEI